MNEMPNKVLVTITKAKTGESRTIECRNLRTNIGVNWQVNHMFGVAGAGISAISRIALSSRATAPASADTDLKGELSADGLARKLATFSHTADQSLATLSASWKYTGGSTVTVRKAALAFGTTDLGTSADTHFTITAVSPVAVLDSNDTIAVDWGVNV
jgi:hypothetical protein